MHFQKLASASAAAVLLGTGAAALQTGNVQPPAGWHSGDTHEHIQLCPNRFIDNPQRPGANFALTSHFLLDDTPEEIYLQNKAVNLHVASVLTWLAPSTSVAEYFADYAPLVTGTEHAVSVSDPDYIVQFGIETSGFCCANIGHVSGLNVDDPNIDPDLDYPGQALAFYNAQSKAVMGYAHQAWPTDLCTPLTGGTPGFTNPPGYNFVTNDVCDLINDGMAFPPLTTFNLYPLLGPIDASLRRLDFLETLDTEKVFPPTGSALTSHWWGLYYKLLSVGQRISVAAGSDADCIQTVSGLEARTWVQIDSPPLTYDKWTEGLAEGRVSLAMGPSQFLNLEVDTEPIGSEVRYPSSTIVQVTATYYHSGDAPINEEIEIIRNGEVVAVDPIPFPGDGDHEYTFALLVNTSSWIAARTKSGQTHTGAIYVLIGGQPIAQFDEAEYLNIYTSFVDWGLDIAELTGMDVELVGDSMVEVRSDIAESRKIFEAIRDYTKPLPGGVARIGTSTPPECGPTTITMVTTDPPISATTGTMRCFGAPASTTGYLLVADQTVPGVPFDGSILYVDQLAPLFIMIGATTNEGGYSEVPFQFPDVLNFPLLWAQFLWNNPAGCDSTGTFSSSDALRFTLQ